VQLSFFAADAQPPAIADLDGLLAGPGQVVSSGGTARISVVATDDWRANELLLAFEARGLGGSQISTVEGRPAVRTDFQVSLVPMARAWARGAAKVPPPEFVLDGPRLRMWVVAAGHPDEHGYLLPLAESDESSWQPVGAALAAAGFAATLLGPRAGGPAYRITGRRRLLRLRELIGDPPPGAEDQWPREDGTSRPLVTFDTR
jgi:hypothetical protein